jgi:acetate kinase
LSAGQQFDVKAIGHRVVHGGEYFREAAAINDTVIRRIEDLADLAPLHNPPAAQGIRIAAELFPNKPQVAVFDTAFHQALPTYCVSLRDSLRILRKVSDPPLWISRDEPSFCRA